MVFPRINQAWQRFFTCPGRQMSTQAFASSQSQDCRVTSSTSKDWFGVTVKVLNNSSLEAKWTAEVRDKSTAIPSSVLPVPGGPDKTNALLEASLPYFLTFFLTYLLTFFLTYLLTFFLTYFLTFFLTYLLTFCVTYFLTFFLTYLLTFFLTYLLTWSRLRSGAEHWNTELTGSRLRSGAEHWTHRIVVEVRRGTLASQDRGWGPARNTEHTHGTPNSHDRGWDPTQNTDEEEEEEEDRAHIKSNNPHLTGGEPMMEIKTLQKVNWNHQRIKSWFKSFQGGPKMKCNSRKEQE